MVNSHSILDGEFKLHFSFNKDDIEQLVQVFGWQEEKKYSIWNRYVTSYLLSTCDLVQLFATTKT